MKSKNRITKFTCEKIDCGLIFELSRKPNPKHGVLCPKHRKEATRIREKEWAKNHPLTKDQRKQEYERSRKETCLRYGLTIEEYDQLLKKQNFSCRICGNKNNSDHRNTKLCIDHDHLTNQIRGLLCHRCNLILGLVKDRIDILLSANAYLNENRGIIA